MTTKFIAGCKYHHRKSLDTYIEVLKVEDHDEHFYLIVMMRKKSNDEILGDKEVGFCVLRDSLHEWNPWLK